MDPNDKPVLVYATFPDLGSAEAAAGRVVEAGLAACVNILPGMVSIYRWQGAVQRDQECVALFKTRGSLSAAVIAAASAGHPYTTPAFLVLAIEGGAADYLSWLMAETAVPGGSAP